MYVEMVVVWSTHISTPCGILRPKHLLEGGREVACILPHVHRLLGQPKFTPCLSSNKVNSTLMCGGTVVRYGGRRQKGTVDNKLTYTSSV